MTKHNRTKLNKLIRELPDGLLVDASWLEQRGYSRSLRSQYVASGWLSQPVRGVYSGPQGVLTWQQVVISLQSLLGLPVSVGGRTALEQHGYAHYLTQSHQQIHLYSDMKLPSWLGKLGNDWTFVVHSRTRILPKIEHEIDVSITKSRQRDTEASMLRGGLHLTYWGEWKRPLIVSGIERASLEMMDELPDHESFHNVDMMMEGLVNIRPSRMQSLLEFTQSIKVKRLFFFFASRHNHRWLTQLDKSKIDLGKGKRSLVKGGKFDPLWQITVPVSF